MITIDKTDTQKLEDFLRENYRLDQRIEAIKNKKLYSLEIELTRRCNLECIYCYNSSSRNSGIPDFNFDLLKRVLREAYEYGIRSITYLGGEPTLHPEINDIITFTKDIGMEEVVLYTNGTVMNSRLLDSINEHVDAVVFHMDTINRDIFTDLHNIERQSSFRYFDAILDNLKKLLESGYDAKKLRHCLTLFRSTYETLEKTLRWATENEGMLTSIFIPVIKIGRGASIPYSKMLDIDEIKSSYEMRAKIEKRPELLLMGPSEYFKQYQLTMAYISCDGFLSPYAGYSRHIHLYCSNNSSRSLLDIIYRNYQFLVFKSGEHSQQDKEVSCKNGFYCFGTRTALEYTQPSHLNCDPNCWL